MHSNWGMEYYVGAADATAPGLVLRSRNLYAHYILIQQAIAVYAARPASFIYVFWSIIMSTHTKQRTFLRASLRLFVALAFFGAMLVTNQSTTSAAAPCPPTCTVVMMYNCVWPPVVYQVKFILCCNGVLVTTPPLIVPAPAAPPPPCAMTPYIPPSTSSCPTPVVVGVAGINPPPPGGFVFDPVNCTLKIF